jgi:FKBP-type peptidyl-prolyl cis-trans isomerase
MRWLVFLSITLTMANGCAEQGKNEKLPTQKQVNKGLEDVNRQMMLEEDAVIEGYIERRQWNMTKTGTGVHYQVLSSGPEGPTAREGQVAVVSYEVSLIDGEVIYSSEDEGQRSFMIGQDNVESGIHEAMTYLKKGDKARIILPSYRAHGLSGDNDKIPPRSTVIYELELIDLR